MVVYVIFGCIWLYLVVHGCIWRYMVVCNVRCMWSCWWKVVSSTCIGGVQHLRVKGETVLIGFWYKNHEYRKRTQFGKEFWVTFFDCMTCLRNSREKRIKCTCPMSKNALVRVPRESCCFVHLCLSSICVEFVLRRFDVFLHTVICQTCEDNGWHYTK